MKISFYATQVIYLKWLNENDQATILMKNGKSERLSLPTLRLNEMAFHHIELTKCIASIFNILCTKLTNWNKMY